jgi:hypothetical protein
MRQRIFSRDRWRDLAGKHDGIEEPLISEFDQHFELFGGVDWAYHGDHVYDYSFASLALVKRA